DVQECIVDVARHASRVAADVEMGAVLDPPVELGSMLAQPVLDVDLARLVTRESEVDAAEHAAAQPVLPFRLIEEIAAEMALAEHEPAPAADAAGLALLHEAAIRRDAGPRADHHDRRIAILRQPEIVVALDVDRHQLARPDPVSQEGRGNSASLAAVQAVAYRRKAD